MILNKTFRKTIIVCTLGPATASAESISDIKIGAGKTSHGCSSGIKMKIFIGGRLSYNITEGDLRKAFEAFGQVISTSVVKDQESVRSKGFGFVEMPEQAETQSAIAALNGQAGGTPGRQGRGRVGFRRNLHRGQK